jgi:hypothetical protein
MAWQPSQHRRERRQTMNQAELKASGALAGRPTKSSTGTLFSAKTGRHPLLADALVLLGLSSLAIAQPLLDVLGRDAEFFIASKAKPLDLVFLVILLCLIIPGLLFGLELLFGILGKRVRAIVHLAFVGLLSAFIALPLIKRLRRVPLPVVLLTATIVGVAIGLSYLKLRPVRLFLAFLAVAALVVPGNFIFNTRAARILFPKRTAAMGPKITARTPVVMVIFDCLPLTSLLTERNQVDMVRYPNFAAFSKEAYWFRKATTVSTATVRAIPSILSGNYPKPGLMPTSSDYPHSLFTLFGESYEMHVFESSTHMCPDRLCAPLQASPGSIERMRKILNDVAIVYGHIVLPDIWAARLPSVAEKWNDFAADSETSAGDQADVQAGGIGREVVTRWGLIQRPSLFNYEDRRTMFAALVSSIKPSDRPVLYFVHVMIPHGPCHYLPSGKAYASNKFDTEGLINDLWQKDLAPTLYQYQRHLLQVGFADKLLGDFLAKLKESRLYDPALVVVMSDHGVSFIPGDNRRGTSETNYQDILPVPLFIKLPGQHEGIVSERNVETIDALPTIVDLLDISMPWAMDGRSAFDTSQPEKDIKIKIGDVTRKVLTSLNSEMMKAVKRRTQLFGSECAWDRLFVVGKPKNLIGRPLEVFLIDSRPVARLELDNVDDYAAIDPHSDFIPARIRGRIFPGKGQRGPFNLAIAVNHTIRAITETFPWLGKQYCFAAMVPEESFQPGSNSIQVLIVTGSEKQPRLQLTQLQRSEKIKGQRKAKNKSQRKGDKGGNGT